MKGVYVISTHKENECPFRISDRMPKYLVSDLMEEQNWLKKEIKTRTVLLAPRDAEINVLKAALADKK